MFTLNNGFASLNIKNDDLPIKKYKQLIIDTIKKNRVTIIYGDTGSGKTTQIPQYLLEAGINQGLMVGVTQPRKIAAVSMARRVAQEMDCGLGIEVGYEVRFASKFSGSTKIKYMTDGMLLNHCLTDPRLLQYSVIMIDEAHERTINTDVLLGLLKTIVSKREDLKVLITSATMKTEKFSTYFNGAPIVSFEGRLFPVEVVYQSSYAYLVDSVRIVKNIHMGNENGDILVFLTGQDDIDLCCEHLKGIENMLVLPLYGSMDCDSQQKVFGTAPLGQRKVIVATNIAETTITIDGIKFVIDCGYVKQSVFNASIGMSVLQETRISKSQSDQRKGRAGRTSSGRCYRLYSDYTYEMMCEEVVPDILRKNLCEIYLKLVAIGLDPMKFDFIDKPTKENLEKSEEELQTLDLLDESKCLTEMGKNMSDLPVEPILGKVLLSASEFHCTKDVLTIMSMMTERNIFKRSKKDSKQANLHKLLVDPLGDHLTRLNVFKEFEKNGKLKSWCYANFLNYDTLARVDQTRQQLMMIMLKKKIAMDSLPLDASKDPIRKAIIKGYYRNICVKVAPGKYIRYLGRKELFIHPGSCLFQESPQLILYHEVVQTKKPYMHGLMKLDISILADFPVEMRKINFRADGTISRSFMDFFM